jgi:uncharacterized protein
VTLSDWHGTNQLLSDRLPAIKLPDGREMGVLSPKIKEILQIFKRELGVLYGERLADLVLYGSFARQEETEESDIDVLVVLKGTVSPVDEIWRMGEAGMKLLLEYGELISVVPTSQDDFLHRASPLLDNIRREGILL